MSPAEPRDDDGPRLNEPAPDAPDEDRPDETPPPEPEAHGLRILGQDDVEEDLDEDDEAPRTILITGACGNVGRKLRAAWEDVYDLVLLDKAATADDPDVIAADLTEWDEAWVSLFDDVDTVIHLAGNPNESAAWDELVGPNVDALANVFHAAAYGGVERLIFASSNHAMGNYRDLGDMPITVDLPPRPDGPYGGLKLVGERMGKSLASAFDLTFIAIRLGWIQPGANRPETLRDDWSRQLWLSNDDLVHLFDCAVEAEIGERNFLVVNGMSHNRGMRWDLSEAAEWLGFEPADDSGAESI